MPPDSIARRPIATPPAGAAGRRPPPGPALLRAETAAFRARVLPDAAAPAGRGAEVPASRPRADAAEAGGPPVPPDPAGDGVHVAPAEALPQPAGRSAPAGLLDTGLSDDVAPEGAGGLIPAIGGRTGPVPSAAGTPDDAPGGRLVGRPAPSPAWTAGPVATPDRAAIPDMEPDGAAGPDRPPGTEAAVSRTGADAPGPGPGALTVAPGPALSAFANRAAIAGATEAREGRGGMRPGRGSPGVATDIADLSAVPAPVGGPRPRPVPGRADAGVPPPAPGAPVVPLRAAGAPAPAAFPALESTGPADPATGADAPEMALPQVAANPEAGPAASAGDRPAPPPAPSVPLPALRAEVAERVQALARAAEAQGIGVRAGDAPLSTEVELAPAELGRVRLLLNTTERGLNLVVLVDRPDSVEAVRRHLDGLHRNLLADGVSLDSVDIGPGDRRASGGGPSDEAPGAGANGSAAAPPGTPAADGPAPPSADRPPARRGAPGRLDIRL